MDSYTSGDPESAERARFFRSLHHDNDQLERTTSPTFAQHPALVQPSSHEEDEALSRIDEQRAIFRESLGDSSEMRSRRQRKIWGRTSKYGHMRDRAE